jgi:hypothetical protein
VFADDGTGDLTPVLRVVEADWAIEHSVVDFASKLPIAPTAIVAM